MSDEFLGDRRKALEDQFFAKQNAELIEQMRREKETTARSQALSAASGITAPSVLEHLVEHDIGADTLAALALIPLVAVAWADGVVQDQERAAILAGAAEQGLEPSDLSYQLLETWLEQRPDAELVRVWKEYIAALSEEIGPSARAALKDDLLGRARGVAEAAGGLLGIRRVSAEEEAVLSDLEQAFA